MEILPITIAAPRADRIGTQTGEAEDGWFDKLLRASDERPYVQDPAGGEEPEAYQTAESDRTAEDRPADGQSSATPPSGDEDAGAAGDLATRPWEPADDAAATAPVGPSPQQPVVAADQPAAKVPPARPTPGTRSETAQTAQLAAAPPGEKTTQMGPRAAAPTSGASGTAPPIGGAKPGAAPDPSIPTVAAAPSSPLRSNARIENRPKDSAAGLSAKPSDVGEGPATRRRGAATAKTAASNKASAEGEAPRAAPNVQQGLGALSGLAATGARAATDGIAAQPLGMTTATPGPGQGVASGNPVPAESRPAAPPGGATEQVALRIHKAAAGGQERISIRLHPAELGRIEVKLAWSDDGLMRALISADKGETLELLQRDQRALERSLQDAGIKTDSGSLSFDLRGQGGRGEASDESDPQTADGGAEARDEAERSDDALPPAATRSPHRGLLDLSV